MPFSLSVSEFERTINVLSDKVEGVDIELIVLSRMVRLLNVQMTARLSECLRQHGLSESLWHALVAVYTQPQNEILPSELSDILDLTRTSATRLSDELVQNGWVIRYTHPQDRRKITLKLTEQGERLIHQVSPFTNEVRHNFWSAVQGTEREAFRSLLQKLLTNR